MHKITFIFLSDMYLNDSWNQSRHLLQQQLLCCEDDLLYDNSYLWIYGLCPEKRFKNLFYFHINILIQLFLFFLFFLLLLYSIIFKDLFPLRQIVGKVCIRLIILFILFFIDPFGYPSTLISNSLGICESTHNWL